MFNPGGPPFRPVARVTNVTHPSLSAEEITSLDASLLWHPYGAFPSSTTPWS